MFMSCSPLADKVVQKFEGNDKGKPWFQTATNFKNLAIIGWGHVIGPGEKIPMPMTYDRAHSLLAQDLKTVCNQLQKHVDISKLKQHEIDALCSWLLHVTTDNCKHLNESWETSSLLKYVREGLLQLAAGEFGKWCVVNGRMNMKFYARRMLESSLFVSGII